MKIDEAVVADEAIGNEAITYLVVRALFLRSRRSRIKSITIRASHLFISS